jgi:transcription termination factor NusB
VAIHEAVNLARAFSTEKSYAFVNGILDAVAKRKGLAA